MEQPWSIFDWCESRGLNTNTAWVLESNGVITPSALRNLTEEEISQLKGVRLGQKSILKKVLFPVKQDEEYKKSLGALKKRLRRGSRSHSKGQAVPLLERIIKERQIKAEEEQPPPESITEPVSEPVPEPAAVPVSKPVSVPVSKLVSVPVLAPVPEPSPAEVVPVQKSNEDPNRDLIRELEATIERNLRSILSPDPNRERNSNPEEDKRVVAHILQQLFTDEDQVLLNSQKPDS